MIKKEKIQKAIDFLLLAIMIVFPVAINIALISPNDPGHPIISINFSLADLLLFLILTIWIIKIVIYKEIKTIRVLPISILVFVGIEALSLFNAFSITEWMKEMIKMIEYFVIFYLLLLNNLKNIKTDTIKNILFVLAIIILFIALIQHFLLNGSPYLIRGLFDNRNVLGVYLCIIIPLVYAEFLYQTNPFKKIVFFIMLMLSLIVLMSGSALLSIFISLSVISLYHSKSVFIKYIISICILCLIYYFVMPQKNLDAIKEFTSINEQGKISENYYRRLTILGDLKKNVIIQKRIGQNSLEITNDLFAPSTISEIVKGNAYSDMDEKKNIKNRYLEMQASLNMIAKNTLLGVGLGNFQTNVGSYYGDIPKVNTAEPNQHNGYLIIASTTGVLGLAAFLWILIFSLTNNYRQFKTQHNINKQSLYLGLFGSILACIIENNFSYLFTASLLTPFILIIYLSNKFTINPELKSPVFKLTNLYIRLVIIGLVLVIAGFTFVTSIKYVGAKEYIWIEAESAKDIKLPLEVLKMEGTSENKVIAAIGSHHVSQSFVSYDFYINEDGNFTLWGRCYWPQVCANSFNIAIDNESPIFFGEDPTLNQWHWISIPLSGLKKGQHKLILWNRENDAMIDKFLITSDNSYIPSGFGQTANRYIDFGNGRLPDDMSGYNKEKWTVIKDGNTNNNCLFLSKSTNGKREMAFFKVNNPENYIYRLAFRSIDNINNNLQVFFNFKDEQNYASLEIQNDKAYYTRLYHGLQTDRKEIIQQDHPFLSIQFNDLAIHKEKQFVNVKLNGNLILSAIDDTLASASIVGVGSITGNLLMDNIAITSESPPNLYENFHGTFFRSQTTRPEISPDYFDKLKSGRHNWWIIKGHWTGTDLYDNSFEDLEGKANENENALIVFGDYFWCNYSLSFAAKTNGKGGLGAYFNFQDTDNYYKFSWEKIKNRWVKRAIKVKNKKVTILSEVASDAILPGMANWYKFQLKSLGEKVDFFIDDQLIFSIEDSTFTDGKAGLWTSCKEAKFDDIVVAPTDNVKEVFNGKRYTFQVNEHISLDFSDWVPSREGFIHKDFYLDKKLFETSFIQNKKTYSSKFNIATQTNDVPQDIDVNYKIMTENNRGNPDEYLITVGTNKVSLFKNSNLLSTQKVTNFMNRNNIGVQHTDGNWEILLNSTQILTYNDKSQFKNSKISFGLSGIGKGHLILYEINIRNQD